MSVVVRSDDAPPDLAIKSHDAPRCWRPDTHVELSLIDPSGVVRALSLSIPSVFEREGAAGVVKPGPWKLRVRGDNVPTGGQTVS